MVSEAHDDDCENRALELANLAITAGADGDYETARNAWREALAYAEQHGLL
jgi:uncharacterized membrane-anchored protein